MNALFKDIDLPADGPAPYERIKDEWNAMAAEHGFRKVRSLDDERKAKLRARWKEPMFRLYWPAVLANLPKIPFLAGKNDRGWKATFDFVIRNSTKYKRIVEGEYGDPVEAAPPVSAEDASRQADAMALYDDEKEKS